MNPKKLVSLFLATLILILAGNAPAQAAPETNPLNLAAKSAFLMDVRTGRVMYAYNEEERIQPASLAKILTFDMALEALEKKQISLEDEVPVSEKAWRLSMDQGVSRMFIEVGDKVKLEDLLYGLMVSSGNDAAVALAEFLAGTEDDFVRQMNARVAQLGLTDTRFSNAHGLEAPDQYTTAKDMARLAQHLILNHPEGLKYTSSKQFVFNGIPQNNWNKLLFQDPRVNGLKTGHLASAGYHLVATAKEKEGETYLIGVVMGTASEDLRAREAERLLDWGFKNFSTVEVPPPALPATLPVYKGEQGTVPVKLQGDTLATVPREDTGKLKAAVELEELVVAPLPAGSQVGQVTITSSQGEPLKSVAVVTAGEVKRGGFFRVLWDSLRLLFRRL
ncbi:MAG: D-alanyl-D-alanine carboxypeptidase [Clostridia bacterium]|nr:MAG: D-alanyl-D-alanine carboxypeptidase [Clostridia bacterium]